MSKQSVDKLAITREEAFSHGCFQPWAFANPMVDMVEDSLTKVFPPVQNGLAKCIPADAVEHLTELAMAVVAEMVQCYIDAGSERDVTMENEALYEALKGEFAGWALPGGES